VNFIRNRILTLFLRGTLLLLIAGTGLQSCSTKKNKLVNRTYHNITARYNGYFYACEAIKDGVSKLEAAHKDDFTRVLPVYKLAEEKDAKSIYPEMNRAYEKSSNVINRHSIMIRNTEYVNWIDDNYLAIGISHYYKRDYFAAAEIFDYIIKQYKKEEIRYDAMVWLIRTYNENAIVSQAQMLIDMLDNDKKFPKRIRADLDMAITDFHLKRENYSMAAKYAEKALLNVKKKKQKVRLNYILAQLYQKNGDDKKAVAKFEQVLKMHPDNETAFQAKINQARSYSGSDSKGKKGIKPQLEKMLKDQKNSEYFDQIHYALAEIALKETDEQRAIDHLKKSVSVSENNQKQKGLSYLLLGDIFLKKPDYYPARAYYDSSVTALPSNYPGFNDIMEKKEVLSDLIENLSTISREDSLQRIAKMSESERDRFLDTMIEKLVKAEEKRIKEEKERQEQLANQQVAGNNSGGSADGNTQGGIWYFDNRNAMSFGFNDFRKKWGDRKLEDNWRRSIKQSNNFAEAEEDKNEINPTTPQSQEDVFAVIRNKEQYLNALPLSEEKMKESTEKIIEAYYNAGAIFKEQLQDSKSAVKILEEFINHYPENKYKLQSYYRLYRSNLAIPNNPRAEYYKNILLTNYPDSEYSRIIRNPNSAKATTASKDEIERFYIETYDHYNSGRYSMVITNCSKADTDYAKSAYSAKFDLLQAMAIGRTQGASAFEKALQEIVAEYPADPVKERAEELLDYLAALNPSQEQADTSNSKYKINREAPHNFLMITESSIDLNDLKIAVSDFNAQYFGTESNLNITGLPLNASKQMVVVTGFTDQAKAMKYYNAIKGDTEILKKTGAQPVPLIIAADNYPVFYQEKNIEEYLEFFNKKYLKK
jgi:tetratricopeptide (TPR) repeat protein